MSALYSALASLGMGLASALIPVVNIEAYMVGVSALSPATAQIAAFCATIGHTAGKWVIYQGAKRGTQSAWVQKKTSGTKFQTFAMKWQDRLGGNSWSSALLLLSAAALGLPPLLFIAVLAGTVEVNPRLFLACVFIGRWVRFAVLAATGAALVELW